MIRPLQCPICRKSVAAPAAGPASFFPFCSERCRQIDLLRWSRGQYAIVERLDLELLENRRSTNRILALAPAQEINLPAALAAERKNDAGPAAGAATLFRRWDIAEVESCIHPK